MNSWPATVLGRRALSAHLVRVTVAVDATFPGTGVPDESVTVHLPQPRVYTVSDLRRVDGGQQVDLDIVLHGRGPGVEWARTCTPGDAVSLSEPHGSYAPPPGVGPQLLVADLTGVPALARILRGLDAGQQARAVVVITDPADRLDLPSPAEVDVEWVTVAAGPPVSEALRAAVLEVPDPGNYVWFAGEARAGRAIRQHLRRERGWPQSALSTLGYWQLDAEVWRERYQQVAGRVAAEARDAHQRLGHDHGAFLDALEDIYDREGL